MNMQEVEENNKSQVRAQKVAVERFLAALHLLTIQTGIEIFAPGGFRLIESEDHDKPFLAQWADGVHYRGRKSGLGYVAKSWHPDLMENKEGSNE